MALSIGQIAAVSYEAVLNESRTPQNQWVENAALREFERQGMIKKESFGKTLEETLDYRRNPGGEFLATDLAPTSSTKTEVLTAASYSPAEISVPVVWSKRDEVQNPSQNQKVSLVKSLLTNGIDTHDDLIEEAIFASSSTNGFHSALVLIPVNGQGTVGGINAGDEAFWRNQTDSYQSDGSDIEAVFTEVWNSCAKGSGSALSPKLMFSGSDTHALFESTQTPQQRYVDTQELQAGFKVLGFKTARYIFSQYGTDNVFFTNPKVFRIKVSKQYFRDKGEQMELEDANGWKFHIYSSLQLMTGNKSRLGIASQA